MFPKARLDLKDAKTDGILKDVFTILTVKLMEGEKEKPRTAEDLLAFVNNLTPEQVSCLGIVVGLSIEMALYKRGKV